MNKIFFLILLCPWPTIAQTYMSDGTGKIPEMSIRLEDGYVYIKGMVGEEYRARAIPQHTEIYFNVPNNCECGVKPGEYSGVPTKEFLELFTPYFGVIPAAVIKP